MVYSEYVTAVANLLILLETITNASTATPSSDANFNSILPRAIEYAEQRMYRELDLIQTVTSTTASTTANSRSVTIPAGYIDVQSVWCITPAGSAPTDPTAARAPLVRLTVEGLNMFWPQGQSTNNIQPKYYANLDNSTIYIAPPSPSLFTLEFFGTKRPAALSATNTSTILTTYIPDIFVACSMVFFSGYQRDFGAQASDPQMAVSWEAQYQTLKGSAQEEIARMKSEAEMWDTFSDAGKATSNTGGK